MNVAGHSKWKNIQHRKGRQDAIRGRIFAKIGKEIYVAARQGDKDPVNNTKLRLAIVKAKAQNMPNENIERAIKKAAGAGEGSDYVEVTYEGYGPGGIAVMVEALTDNRNRTAADMRYVFSKSGGNLGESGCVSWMFERKALLFIEQGTSTLNEEDVMLLALEEGAEDVETTEEGYLVVSSPEVLEVLREALEREGFTISMSEVTFIPSNKISLEEKDLEKVLRMVDTIEEYDDVQNVYTNVDME